MLLQHLQQHKPPLPILLSLLPLLQPLFNPPQQSLLVPLGQRGALSMEATAPVNPAQRPPFVRRNVLLRPVSPKLMAPGILQPACSAKGPIALPSVKPTKLAPKGKHAFKHLAAVSPVSHLVIPSTSVTSEKDASDVVDAISSPSAPE